MSESVRNPLITPESIPQAIPDAFSVLPRLSRQALAGIATIPSEAIGAASIVANPNRFIRQLQGEATPDDATGVAATLQGTRDSYNALVNRTLGVDDPSVLDDTSGAVARFLGNSLPAAPLRLPAAAAYAVANAPRIVRTLSEIPLKAVELLTPLSLTTSTSVAGRAANVAANVGVQTVLGGAIESGLEQQDPTQSYNVLNDSGQLEYTVLPDRPPGVGRAVANGVTTAVGDNPVAAGLGGLALAGGALFAHRSARQAAAQRAVLSTSDVVVPTDRSLTDQPIIQDGTATGFIRDKLNRVGEIVQDSDIRTKDALEQSISAKQQAHALAVRTAQANGQPPPTRPPPADDYQAVRDTMDITSPQAQADRLIATAEQGIMHTPLGEINIGSLRRWAESLAFQSRREVNLKKNADELIALRSEKNNREYADRMGADKIEIDRTTFMPPETGALPSNLQTVTRRATLPHIDDASLDTRIADITRNDPTAVKYAERYFDIHRKFADGLVNFGLVSKAERIKWGNANPDFMHMTNLDDPKSPRTYRLREHGTVKTAGDPTLSSVEYMDFMLAHAYNNRRVGHMVEALRDYNATPFSNGKWLGRVADPTEIRRTLVPTAAGTSRKMTVDDLALSGDVIHYYKNGEMVRAEIRNKQIYNSIKVKPSQASGVIGWTRQLAQSGMTGQLATLTGQPFSIANAFMGAMMGYLTRPAGMSFGMLDKGAQWLTGGRMGIRMDPTAIPGMLMSAGSDTKAILTRAISESFYNSLDGGGMISKVVGVRGTKAIADRAAKSFLDSSYAQSARVGSGNASSLGDMDFDTAGNRASMISTITPHGNLARVVGTPQDFSETLQLWKGRVVPADAKIALRMISDINEAVGNMAQTYLFRSNRGKADAANAVAVPIEQLMDTHRTAARPHVDAALSLRKQARTILKSIPNATPQQLSALRLQAKPLYAQARAELLLAKPDLDAFKRLEPAHEAARKEWFKEYNKLGVATRQLLGDPAQMGTALRDYDRPTATGPEKAIGMVLTATPYANIGMQASARLIRAAKENPYGTATAIALGITPMAVLPYMNAIRIDDAREARGEERIYEKYDLARPGWHTSRMVPFYMDGIPPDEAPVMRTDPLISFPLTLMREAVIAVYNNVGNLQRDPILGESKEALMRIAGERREGNILTSLWNVSPLNQIPPVFGAPLAASGVEFPEFSKLFGRGAGLIQQGGLGGFENTRLVGSVINRTWEAIIGQLAGSAGLSWVGAINQGAIGEKATPGTFARNVLNELGGKARARLPEVQPLWGQPQQRATNDVFADEVNARESVVAMINKNLPSVNTPGTLGRGRGTERVGPNEGRAGVDDPRMQQLLNATVQFGRAMTPLREARSKTREMMIAVDQHPTERDFVTRLTKRNEYAREVSRINAELLSKYTAFEERVSDRLGFDIRVNKIDPTKPITQFQPLTR